MLKLEISQRFLRRHSGGPRCFNRSPAGRGRHDHRRQRRRQEHPAQEHRWVSSRSPADELSSMARTSPRLQPIAEPEWASLFHRKAAAFSPISRFGTIFCSVPIREKSDAAQTEQKIEQFFAMFPRLKERQDQHCRHTLRRRAADAGHRPRADERTQASAARRTVARSRAADHPGHLQHDPRPARDRPHHPARRADGQSGPRASPTAPTCWRPAASPFRAKAAIFSTIPRFAPPISALMNRPTNHRRSSGQMSIAKSVRLDWRSYRKEDLVHRSRTRPLSPLPRRAIPTRASSSATIAAPFSTPRRRPRWPGRSSNGSAPSPTSRSST